MTTTTTKLQEEVISSGEVPPSTDVIVRPALQGPRGGVNCPRARAPLLSPLARHGLFKRVGAHSLGRQTRQAVRRRKARWERDEEDCKLVHNLLARPPTKPNQISP